MFRGAPFVAFACYLTVSAIVPIITDEPLPLAFLADLIGGAFVLSLASFVISLAALDTASPLGGLGASRTTWIGSFAEPALILVFFTVGALSASDNPYLRTTRSRARAPRYVLPTHLLGAVAFFMLVLAENGRIPIDNPSGTHRDLDDRGEPGARVLRPRVRAGQVGRWMKLFLLSSIFMNVFVIPWGLGDATSLAGGLLGILALFGKLGGVRAGDRGHRQLVRQAPLLPDRGVSRRGVPAGADRNRDLLRDRDLSACLLSPCREPVRPAPRQGCCSTCRGGADPALRVRLPGLEAV